jgi:Big-like domain-containing protein
VRPQLSNGTYLPRLAVAGLAVFGIGCSDSVLEPTAAMPTVEALTPRELSGTVAQAVEPTPRIVLKDRNGRPVPGIRVLFSPVGGGTLSPGDGYVITDDRGIAELGEWRLPERAGTYELRATITGWPLLKFTAQALPDVPAAIASSGQPDVALPGITTKFVVTIADKFGNAVRALPVTFSVIAGSGSLSRTETVTNAEGRAETDWTLGSPGENTVRASAADLFLKISIAAVDPAEWTFYDLLSIADNYNSQIVSRSWIALDAVGHFLNFMEFRSGGRSLLAGRYQLTPLDQTRFALVLEGHLRAGCEEHGVTDGAALQLDRYPFLECDDEWTPARWSYQRRGSFSR